MDVHQVMAAQAAQAIAARIAAIAAEIEEKKTKLETLETAMKSQQSAAAQQQQREGKTIDDRWPTYNKIVGAIEALQREMNDLRIQLDELQIPALASSSSSLAAVDTDATTDGAEDAGAGEAAGDGAEGPPGPNDSSSPANAGAGAGAGAAPDAAAAPNVAAEAAAAAAAAAAAVAPDAAAAAAAAVAAAPAPPAGAAEFGPAWNLARRNGGGAGGAPGGAAGNGRTVADAEGSDALLHFYVLLLIRFYERLARDLPAGPQQVGAQNMAANRAQITAIVTHYVLNKGEDVGEVGGLKDLHEALEDKYGHSFAEDEDEIKGTFFSLQISTHPSDPPARFFSGLIEIFVWRLRRRSVKRLLRCNHQNVFSFVLCWPPSLSPPFFMFVLPGTVLPRSLTRLSFFRLADCFQTSSGSAVNTRSLIFKITASSSVSAGSSANRKIGEHRRGLLVATNFTDWTSLKTRNLLPLRISFGWPLRCRPAHGAAT